MDLDQCNVGEFGGDDCYHGKDVGVSCRGYYAINFVRL